MTEDPNKKGNQGNGGGLPCKYCEKHGHKEEKWWKKHSKPSFKCKELGHLRKDCPLNKDKELGQDTKPKSVSFVGMAIDAKGVQSSVMPLKPTEEEIQVMEREDFHDLNKKIDRSKDTPRFHGILDPKVKTDHDVFSTMH